MDDCKLEVEIVPLLIPLSVIDVFIWSVDIIGDVVGDCTNSSSLKFQVIFYKYYSFKYLCSWNTIR